MLWQLCVTVPENVRSTSQNLANHGRKERERWITGRLNEKQNFDLAQTQREFKMDIVNSAVRITLKYGAVMRRTLEGLCPEMEMKGGGAERCSRRGYPGEERGPGLLLCTTQNDPPITRQRGFIQEPWVRTSGLCMHNESHSGMLAESKAVTGQLCRRCSITPLESTLWPEACRRVRLVKRFEDGGLRAAPFTVML